MRHFRTLLAHELRSAALSGNTWAAAGLFLALMGGIHFFALVEASRGPADRTPVESTLWFFWLPLLCVLPLLTMRTFAEERVWAKFLATWVVWVVFWLLFTLFPFLTVQRLGTPGDARLGDPSVLWGGLCFIAVSGLLHVAIGILCSCVTRSSALAALLAFISLLAMTAAGGAMESLPIESWEWLGWLREPAAHLRTFGHLQDFAAGILDSRPIVLYGTGTLLCLGLAVLSVEGQE
jgi:ABC-2 type transport system permease protein